MRKLQDFFVHTEDSQSYPKNAIQLLQVMSSAWNIVLSLMLPVIPH